MLKDVVLQQGRGRGGLVDGGRDLVDQEDAARRHVAVKGKLLESFQKQHWLTFNTS